jgi:hypothetical protein
VKNNSKLWVVHYAVKSQTHSAKQHLFEPGMIIYHSDKFVQTRIMLLSTENILHPHLYPTSLWYPETIRVECRKWSLTDFRLPQIQGLRETDETDYNGL